MQRPRKLQNFEIAVVGLGNLLLGDEGFGVHFIRYLKTFHSLPPSVELIDGGCLGLRILDLFREKEALIVIDILLAKSPPGTIKTLSWEEIKNLGTAKLASGHQVGIKEALALAELIGIKPKYFKAFGVVPAHLGVGTELSPALKERLPVLAEMVLAEIKNLAGEADTRR